MRRRQAGFTLLELMVVIALVGVLAALALPALLSTKRKAANATEVGQFFAELRVREDQWYGETGSYKATSAANTEAGMFPATPSTGGQTVDPAAMPDEWKALRIRLPVTSEVHCTYTVVVGDATNQTIGAQATAMPWSPPAKNWYYLLARCNADGNASTDGWFLESSESSEILSLDDDK